MQVTLLGTGSALPSADRVQSSLLIEDGPHRLLVDCGSGALHRLAQAGFDAGDIDTLLLTHHHLDHVADLPSLVKARVLTGHEKFRVVGREGTRSVAESLLRVDDLNERADVSIDEPTTEAFEVAGFDVRVHGTRHSKPCNAYRFGDRLGISGDTEPFGALSEFFDGVDVLVHECAYPDDVDADGHTTPTELGEQLAGRDVDRLYLTHLFPEAEARAADLASAVERNFDGEVTVATDGARISL